MDKTGADLTGDEFFPFTDADSVGAQSYQHQGYPKIALELVAYRLGIVAVGQIFFGNGKRGQYQVPS